MKTKKSILAAALFLSGASLVSAHNENETADADSARVLSDIVVTGTRTAADEAHIALADDVVPGNCCIGTDTGAKPEVGKTN